MPATVAFERRTLATDFEVRTAPNGNKIVAGYAAKFDRYSENLGGFVEVVRAGFFRRALGDDRIKGRFEHGHVLGRSGNGTLRVSEDDTGLPYEIEINSKDPMALSALAQIERGDVNKSSFAFAITRDGDEWRETEQGFPLRCLLPGGCSRLFDVSPVADPAYDDTESSVRALRSFARAHEIDPEVVDAAAQSGELIDLIRGARNLAPVQIPVPTAAAAPAASVRLEMERLATRRRARSRPL